MCRRLEMVTRYYRLIIIHILTYYLDILGYVQLKLLKVYFHIYQL